MRFAVALLLLVTTSAFATPGVVLSVQPASLSPQLAAVGSAKRIRYVSTSPDGAPIVVSGLVLTPKLAIRLAKPQAADKVVAWAHGTEGLADHCAPSNHPTLDADPSYPFYEATVAGYLAQGWTVAATDYPGLGTFGPHPYLKGESEGRAVIDSVRAARRLDPRLTNAWVVSGHSQGGQAALFASELAATYGAGLSLKGTVAIAPAAYLELLAVFAPGTPANGYVVMAVFGLAALDPAVRPLQVLAPPARAKVGVLQTGCLVEALTAFGPLTASELIQGGAFTPDLLAKFAESNPGTRPSASPVLLVQGELDETVPLTFTQGLQAEMCGVGTQPVRLDVALGATHDTVLTDTAAAVNAYISARFAGLPASGNCP